VRTTRKQAKRGAPAAQTQPESLAPGLLTKEEAAAWLRVSPRTLATLAIRRVKITSKILRYDVRDLQQFADLHGDRDRLTSGSAA